MARASPPLMRKRSPDITKHVLQKVVFPFFFGIGGRIDVPGVLAFDRNGDELVALQIACEIGVRFKAAVMPGESMQQVKHGVANFAGEVIFGQDHPILHFSLQGLAEELYVLHALIAVGL